MPVNWDTWDKSELDTIKSAYDRYGRFGDDAFKGDNLTLKNSDKWFTESGAFGNKFSTTDTSIAFKKVMGNEKTMTFPKFKEFLGVLAETQNPQDANGELKRIVTELQTRSAPGTHDTTKVEKSDVIDRLTDPSKYTGTQRFSADVTYQEGHKQHDQKQTKEHDDYDNLEAGRRNINDHNATDQIRKSQHNFPQDQHKTENLNKSSGNAETHFRHDQENLQQNRPHEFSATNKNANQQRDAAGAGNNVDSQHYRTAATGHDQSNLLNQQANNSSELRKEAAEERLKKDEVIYNPNQNSPVNQMAGRDTQNLTAGNHQNNFSGSHDRSEQQRQVDTNQQQHHPESQRRDHESRMGTFDNSGNQSHTTGNYSQPTVDHQTRGQMQQDRQRDHQFANNTTEAEQRTRARDSDGYQSDTESVQNTGRKNQLDNGENSVRQDDEHRQHKSHEHRVESNSHSYQPNIRILSRDQQTMNRNPADLSSSNNSSQYNPNRSSQQKDSSMNNNQQRQGTDVNRDRSQYPTNESGQKISESDSQRRSSLQPPQESQEAKEKMPPTNQQSGGFVPQEERNRSQGQQDQLSARSQQEKSNNQFSQEQQSSRGQQEKPTTQFHQEQQSAHGQQEKSNNQFNQDQQSGRGQQDKPSSQLNQDQQSPRTGNQQPPNSPINQTQQFARSQEQQRKPESNQNLKSGRNQQELTNQSNQGQEPVRAQQQINSQGNQDFARGQQQPQSQSNLTQSPRVGSATNVKNSDFASKTGLGNSAVQQGAEQASDKKMNSQENKSGTAGKFDTMDNRDFSEAKAWLDTQDKNSVGQTQHKPANPQQQAGNENRWQKADVPQGDNQQATYGNTDLEKNKTQLLNDKERTATPVKGTESRTKSDIASKEDDVSLLSAMHDHDDTLPADKGTGKMSESARLTATHVSGDKDGKYRA